MRLLLAPIFLLPICAEAADWQPLGASELGKHFVDRASLQWSADESSFTVDTRIEEKADQEWLLMLQVRCTENTFSYLKGRQSSNGKVLAQFDKPRAPEQISKGSMPDQLKTGFCGKPGEIQWQPVGKSNISTVYYDPSSIRQSGDGRRFQANTRVVPFKGDEVTFSSLDFNCAEQTFVITKMSKLKEGKLQQVFDKPQPATPTSRTATLDKLVKKFCSQPAKASGQKASQPECEKVVGQIKAIEASVQKDYDNGSLKCAQGEAYIAELQKQGKLAEQYQCPVNSLESYIQTVKDAACGQ